MQVYDHLLLFVLKGSDMSVPPTPQAAFASRHIGLNDADIAYANRGWQPVSG
jgi:hypothetical protein